MLSFSSCHATYKTYYKQNPTYYHYPFNYIMTISLSCIMAHLIHAAGQGNWLCWAFYCCIESPVIGIVFHCKHNFYTFIYSKPESNIKNIKIKISSIRHKACLNPILITNWPQTHFLFYENPPTPCPPWELATPEISHEIEGAVQIPHP